ncbi:MAG: glycosyltransferase [Leptolyngbya sp. SIO4C1]|nr:glycosyltransferase [Leptolyngbya sp. SIO4C1]
MNKVRIAWLIPVAWFYWQPFLSEFTKQFPNTVVFTALFPGYAKGYEDTLNIRLIGQWKVARKQSPHQGYGSGLTYISPMIVFSLFKFRPHIIYSNSFGIWTLLALIFKVIGFWKVVIAYEGSAPGVDFLNKPRRLALRRLMARLADGFITNSQAGRDYLIKHLGADEAQVFAYPYEVPAAKSLFAESNEHAPAAIEVLNRPLFLFVGRVMPRKGLKTLLEACIQLKQRGHQEYTLLVIGDGEDLDSLQTYCQNQQIDNCVVWAGQIDYSQIGSYFRAADVFILPTIEDTWGVVVLEAMLFGKAVLCSTGAGSSELISPGDNGFVFRPNHPEELADVMQVMIEHPEKIKLVGEKSRQVMDHHTPESAARFLGNVTACVIPEVG